MASTIHVYQESFDIGEGSLREGSLHAFGSTPEGYVLQRREIQGRNICLIGIPRREFPISVRMLKSNEKTPLLLILLVEPVVTPS